MRHAAPATSGRRSGDARCNGTPLSGGGGAGHCRIIGQSGYHRPMPSDDPRFVREGRTLRDWLPDLLGPDPATRRRAENAVSAMWWGAPVAHPATRRGATARATGMTARRQSRRRLPSATTRSQRYP